MSRPVSSAQVFRVIDANFNRAKEGLRVCEDVYRFVHDDGSLTLRLKQVRHGLTLAVGKLGWKDLLAARNIAQDVGRGTVPSESRRKGVEDIFYANSQRVKESLRVLEEFAKLKDVRVAKMIKKLRYAVYEIEKISLQ